ncbi:MAG TPA: HAMP domain-containing sensor histidine kinase, partial [Cytophagaceae bacterium]|nr:HAMP domain-containing sensor histidine kinase [Cytophagaceae bacterium]
YGAGFFVDITDLKQSRKEATKLAEELSTFLYMASHDLKGPLASVIGLTNIARNDIEDPKALEYLNLIQECTLKLDRSLINFLKIIRIKDNTVNHVPIDLNLLIDDILSSLKHQACFANTEFQINNSLKSEFCSDEDLIRSMIQNLVENSVKYQSRLRKPLVKIELREDALNILITVDDNGRGIDEKIKDKIFNIFYRGDISSNGSGLGLYIVKNAIEKLGGSVCAESKKEGGAFFTLTIPKKR